MKNCFFLKPIKPGILIGESSIRLALRRTFASAGCALSGAPQLVESGSGLFGESASDVLTGEGSIDDGLTFRDV